MTSFRDPTQPDELTPARLLALYLRGESTIIDRAERAIRAFDATDRSTAEHLLSRWHHSPNLARRERAAVLTVLEGASK